MSVGKWFEGAGKSIGTFFSRDLPNVVTKEIPKFFTKTIPSLGKPETFRPELTSWRKRVDDAAARLSTMRALYFESKSRLAATLARYRALSEDFDEDAGASAAAKTIRSIRDKTWDEPATAAEKTWQDVDKSVRAVLGTVTLGLTEPMWAGAEAKRAKQEMDFLKKRHAEYAALLREIDAARHAVDRANADLEARLDELGARAGSVSELAAERNEATAGDARADAALDTARRLAADGVPAQQIALFTGLSDDVVADVVARHGD